MKKSDLLENFKKRLIHLSNTDSLTSFELILKAIIESLEKGERMEVRGFGSISIRTRKPIRGRNPKSGKAIELSERKVPYFRASKVLNQNLN
ncbi:MAG: integration host factor subunit beta [Rickettsiales bacterium TMED289]|nr:MAG: integration host factor subunit beta [Rickettsiales bacterium TMED289]|tara:strand:- start:395 stop:670 length:276 start_codon:yes stop_codon:yes gene_type:complete